MASFLIRVICFTDFNLDAKANFLFQNHLFFLKSRYRLLCDMVLLIRKQLLNRRLLSVKEESLRYPRDVTDKRVRLYYSHKRLIPLSFNRLKARSNSSEVKFSSFPNGPHCPVDLFLRCKLCPLDEII